MMNCMLKRCFLAPMQELPNNFWLPPDREATVAGYTISGSMLVSISLWSRAAYLEWLVIGHGSTAT